MTTRHDVTFPAAGVDLGGWLFLPDGDGPHPAITMAHGFAGVKDHGLARFAEAFADAGFVVLLHDHRGFGASGGEPRQDVNPWAQIEDWRYAISYLETRDEVDAARVGLWGTSYAGGHALVLGATDSRVKAVVSQVPTISGHGQFLRRISPDAWAGLEAAFAVEDRSLAAGAGPSRQAVVSADPAVRASYRTDEALGFYLQDLPDGVWANEVTVRSTRWARDYEPGVYIARISPTPLMMIVGAADVVTLTDLQLDAFQQALPPKELVLIAGGHFDPYLTGFPVSSAAALRWFTTHLAAPA